MFLVYLDDEHIFLVFFPVARCFPQLTVNNLWCVHFDVAVFVLHAAHVILKASVNAPAVWVPEDLAWGLFLHVEQVHFTAQFAVVA